MKTKTLVAIAIVAFAVNACTSRWEYKTVEIEGVLDEPHGDYFDRNFSQNDAFLNNMGAEGWELVSCFPLIETVYPDMGNERLILHIKTNTRTKAIRYVFKKKCI